MVWGRMAVGIRPPLPLLLTLPSTQQFNEPPPIVVTQRFPKPIGKGFEPFGVKPIRKAGATIGATVGVDGGKGLVLQWFRSGVARIVIPEVVGSRPISHPD